VSGTARRVDNRPDGFVTPACGIRLWARCPPSVTHSPAVLDDRRLEAPPGKLGSPWLLRGGRCGKVSVRRITRPVRFGLFSPRHPTQVALDPIVVTS
jgi:hypothetical protein